jgi:Tfp pilus assembly protein PilW
MYSLHHSDRRYRALRSEGFAAGRITRSLRANAGLSLLELMLAFALFAVIFAVGMQAYVTSYSAMLVQEQRHQAMQLVRGVFSNMRQMRDQPGFTFPDDFFARYPHDTVVSDLRSTPSSPLRGEEAVRVAYEDPAANPLLVRVIVEWQDPRNRPMMLEVATLLTDR